MTVIASAVQALTVSAHSGIYGFIMHVIATSTLVTVASVIYRIRHTRVGAVIGLVSGTLAMAGVMMIANHFITPAFTGAPTEAVDAMLVPIILPFNLIKAGINSAVTFLIYKVISKYIIHGEKPAQRKIRPGRRCKPRQKDTGAAGAGILILLLTFISCPAHVPVRRPVSDVVITVPR